MTDCHGVVHDVPDYTTDDEWRRQLDGLRELLRQDFDHLTFLADSNDTTRITRAGFDGFAIYDNFVEPSTWASFAPAATSEGLIFAFNTNPGFDGIARRRVAPDSCYRPHPFLPETDTLDWRLPEDRDRAHRLAELRIVESLHETLRLQTNPCLSNV